MNEHASASCRCGKVKLDINAPPIFRGICYCGSCQKAGRSYGETSGAETGLAEDGGTDFVLYRKDRITCIAGGDALEERRLTPDSPTRRLYARVGVSLPDDGIPAYPGHSVKFVLRLLRAWAAMGFRRPKVTGVP